MSKRKKEWTIGTFILMCMCVILLTTTTKAMTEDMQVPEEVGLIKSYWPKGQPPRECMVIRKNYDGSVDLLEVKTKMNTMKVYLIRRLPDAKPSTLYEIFHNARMPIGVAEVQEDGKWYAQIIRQK